MKKFAKVALWTIVVLAVILTAAVFFMDRVVLHGFNTAAPSVLGVDASLGDAQVRLLRGYVALKELHIGNPEGFKTPGIFDLDEVVLDLDVPSLVTDTVVVECIRVTGAKVTYEQGLLGNNIGALLDLLAKEEEAKEEEEEAGKEGKPAKKVVIRQLDVEGTRLNVALTATMGKAMPVPLPPIHMADIGEESGGVTPLEAIRDIIGGIFSAVQGAIKGAGDLVGSAAGLIGDGASSAAGAVADGAVAVADGAASAASAVANGASATVGKVADGASAAVGAVADGASATVGAVANGASATVGATVEGVKAVGRFLNPFDGKQDEPAEAGKGESGEE